MSNNDEQETTDERNVMDDVINDISSAAVETSEETQESLEEAAEENAEAVEEAQRAADAETIIVTFDDELDAARAVRVVNKALRKRHETIYQGAMVTREEDEELVVEDLSDMGLSDIITGTAEIGFDLGRDGFKLAWTAATTGVALVTTGVRLLRRTAVLTAGLAGSTWTIPRRRRLDSFLTEEELAPSTTALDPGTTAVVIVADHETASEIATDLVRSGGELA